MRYLLILFIALFITHTLRPQTPHFEHSQKTTLNLSVEDSPNESQKITNNIFANINDFEENINHIKLTFEETFTINFEEKAITLIYKRQRFKISDAITFRGFDMASFLSPAFFDLTITLRSKEHKTLKTYHVKSEEAKYRHSVNEWHFPLPAADSTIVMQTKKITITQSIYAYTSENKDIFEKFQSDIENYYATLQTIDNLLNALAQINSDNMRMIPLYNIDINNIRRQIERVKEASFIQNLRLENVDPENFLPKLQKLETEAERKAAIISHLAQSIDDIFFNKGYAHYLRKEYDEALAYFGRSVNANPDYYRSHYRMAEIYFIKGSLDKAADILLSILDKAVHSKGDSENILTLARQIQLEYIRIGTELVKDEKYHDALKAFQYADTFCLATPHIECAQAIYTGIASARYGLYNSFLTIARQAIINDRLELAAKFIYDASRYQREHKEAIPTNLEAENTMQKIIDRLVEKGQEHKQRKDYGKAVEVLEKALLLCNENPEMTCISSLEKEMKEVKTGLYNNILTLVNKEIENKNIEAAERLMTQALLFEKENQVSQEAQMATETLMININKLKYRQYLEKGLTLHNSGLIEEALYYLLKAKHLEKDYIIFPSPILDEKIHKVAMPQINSMVSRVNIKVWGNNLKGAVMLYDSLELLSEKYYLNNDSTVQAQMLQIKNRIRQLECRKIEFDLDKSYRQAVRLKSNKEFLMAFETIYPHVKEALKNKDCNIHFDREKALTEELFPLYDYQQLKRKATTAFLNEDFQQLDSLISEGNGIFEKEISVQTQLQKLNMSYLTNNTSDCGLLLSAGKYFSEHNASFTLTILKAGAIKKCQAQKYKTLQKTLGSHFAKNDIETKEKYASLNSSDTIENNTEWFAALFKAYNRQWRRLQWQRFFQR